MKFLKQQKISKKKTKKIFFFFVRILNMTVGRNFASI